MGLIRRLITGLLALLGLIYGIYFSLKNMQPIDVTLPMIGDYHPPAFVAILGAFLVGVVITALYSSMEIIRKSMQLRKLRKEVNVGKQKPHKRVRRFLREEEPATQPEPSIQSLDSKDF